MILFLRSSDIGIDSRLRRYCHALRVNGLAFAALFWDRDGKAVGDEKVPSIPYRTNLEYGSRSATGFGLIRLNLFALRKIWTIRKTTRLIHAVDLDMAGAAWLINKITRIPYIYDVYDNYPDSRGIQGWRRIPFDWLERRIIRSAAMVILADECRTAQHSPIAPEKLLIVENVPDVTSTAPSRRLAKLEDRQRLKIGYLGTLEPKFRGLEDTIAAVAQNPNLELHIGGTGTLKTEVRDAAALSSRIRFYGPMSHEDGLKMLAKCQVLLGLYYSEVPNHRFAAPNKYFEHLLLGKPMLTSLGTPPGDKVLANGTGWAVADNAPAIAEALGEAHAQPALRVKMAKNAKSVWQKDYADYFSRVVAGEYATRVASLVGSTDT